MIFVSRQKILMELHPLLWVILDELVGARIDLARRLNDRKLFDGDDQLKAQRMNCMMAAGR